MGRRRRKEVLVGKTIKIKTACGNMFLTINHDEGKVAEVQITLGKSGTCVRGLLEFISRHISWTLQNTDIDLKDYIRFLKRHCDDVNCGSPFVWKTKQYVGCLDCMGEIIMGELSNELKTDELKREVNKETAKKTT